MKKMTLLVCVLCSLCISCPKVEVKSLPIEVNSLHLTSYYGETQTRDWQAEHGKIYDDHMILEETIIEEDGDKTITAKELTVPFYRGEWHGMSVSIIQKDLSMKGDIFHFDERTGILTLNEHVEIFREKMKVYGDTLSYDNRTDIVEMESPSGFLS